jgi:hypothetical protein
MTEGHTPTKCSYSGELKVVLTTVPTASKLLIKFSINVLIIIVLLVRRFTTLLG